ncbi:hypothetical protein O181_131970 [Austropuccinia psidii MF-1]|uniref:Uncharacterized protein n=1 Tax=Austropuccinia psidii MF-1 TaxID=1389203 RepID=A0A9Q3L694_9BASI|nr:hypothetical protein [Austropuccinia psidii MF-1]
MHCSPSGAWIGNTQSNPTQVLFVEGVLMTDQSDLSSRLQPKLALMLFTWYPIILFIIESFQNQDFNLKIPREYDGNSHTQCQLLTHTSPVSNPTPPSYLYLFSLTSKQNLIQSPIGSDLPTMASPNYMIQTLSSFIKKPDSLFSRIQKSLMDNMRISLGTPHPLD